MFLYDGKEGSTVGEVEASRGSVVSPSKRMARDNGGRNMDVDAKSGLLRCTRCSWQSRGAGIPSGCRRVQRMEPSRSVSLHDS
jgi:hypothetical protein